MLFFCPIFCHAIINYDILKNSEILPFHNKVFYGMGGLGYNSMTQTMGSFIMFFATSVMGISGTLVGIAIGISSLWDGISDPLVGSLSDRHKSKFFGKRLGFMLCAVFLIAFCNILLWSMPKMSQVGMFLWLFCFLILLETANTFFSTPFSALAIDLAPEYNEQSKLQSYKTSFNIVGMILPSILLYFFMPSISIGVQTAYSQEGFVNIAYINSALVVIFGIICVFGNLRRVQKATPAFSLEKKKSFGELFSGYVKVFKKKRFSCIILGYAIAQIASTFLTGVGMHLFTFCYHFSSSQIAILLVCLFGGAIMSQPLWLKLAKAIDKKGALITALCAVLMGIGLTLITFIFRSYIENSLLFVFVCLTIVVCGFGTGAMYSLPISMYADVISLEEHETGENNSGSYLGYYSFTYNLSNSIALFFMGILLDLIKFDSSIPVQALSVQSGLGRIVFCGCSIALSLAILIFSKYDVKRADVLKAQMEINKRK